MVTKRDKEKYIDGLKFVVIAAAGVYIGKTTDFTWVTVLVLGVIAGLIHLGIDKLVNSFVAGVLAYE